LAIDSAGIIGLLDGKVDSVTVSGDSLFYWKVGVSYGYILPSLNSVWRNTGNSGIDTSVNWLGTNDNKDLVIKTNNSRRFTVNVNGALGIGNTPNYGTSGYLLQTNGSGSAVSWVDHSTLSTSISKISDAVASNTIDNSNHTQSWSWNSRTGVFAALNITSNSTALIGTFPILKISSTGSNVNSGKTATAAEFSSANTGTSSTNIGLITSASGATNNYGLLVTNGNVGIGTSTPIALLQAASGNCDFRFSKGLADVTPSMTVINTSGMAGGLIAGTSGSAFVYDNAGPFYLISESHSAFVNNTLGGGTVRMTLTATGELGINTTSPGEKLEVSGNAKVSGKFIGRNIIYRTLNASDADFTAAVGTAYVLPDAATTARTVTLPAGQDGDIIRFHLPLTPSNHWTFSTAVTLPDGSTYTNIDTYTNSVTTIQYDGANSVWRAVVNL
jgi:hypothetical protein